MPLDQTAVITTVMRWRQKLTAAAWLVVRDTHAADDIFQTVVLKALSSEAMFDAEAAVVSWSFLTCRNDAAAPNAALIQKLLRYLDGTLPQKEHAAVATRLAVDPAARSLLRDLAEQVVCLGELERRQELPAATSPGGPCHPAKPSPRHWLTRWQSVARGPTIGAWRHPRIPCHRRLDHDGCDRGPADHCRQLRAAGTSAPR